MKWMSQASVNDLLTYGGRKRTRVFKNYKPALYKSCTIFIHAKADKSVRLMELKL